MKKPMDALGKAVDWISIAILVIIAVQMGLEVILRYGFNINLRWLEVTSIYLFFYLVLLPAGLLLRRREHLAITLLPDYLQAHHKTKLLWVWNLIISLVMLVFCVVTFYFTVEGLKTIIEMQSCYYEELFGHRVSLTITFSALLIGFFLLSIHALEALIICLRSRPQRSP